MKEKPRVPVEVRQWSESRKAWKLWLSAVMLPVLTLCNGSKENVMCSESNYTENYFMVHKLLQSFHRVG